MVLLDTALPGAFVIEPECLHDSRGFFGRLWNADALAARGLVARFDHCSVSFNRRKGTLRGMHYQAGPFAETKLVRCTRGAIHDVALDLRSESPAYRQWIAVELSADNRRTLYIPAGCAHGFQTLTPDAEVLYMIDAPYSPEHGRGVRWNDPAFGITWPGIIWPDEERTMNERDAAYPDFTG
jgi:dTDP-4-dehydrorhamnose 3,5-epimerase